MPQLSRKIGTKIISAQKHNEDKSTPQISSDVHVLLKHAHIPAILNCNMVLFHLIALVFSLTATVMQYLHIYRTVWWLPQSHAKKALNFYLIDTHLVGYLIVMEVLPFLYSYYKQTFQMQVKKLWLFIIFGSCLLLWIIWIVAFLFFSFCVYMKTPGFYLLILFYPPIAYALIYYHFIPYNIYLRAKTWLKLFLKSLFSIESNKDSSKNITCPPGVCGNNNATLLNGNGNSNISSLMSDSPSHKSQLSTSDLSNSSTVSSQAVISSSIPNDNKLTFSKQNFNQSCDTTVRNSNDLLNPSATQLALEQYGIFYYSKTVRHSAGYVQHNCTMNPEEIREEVELLKADFNRKFRDIFFGTLFTFFYASLVPLLFVPKADISSNISTVQCISHHPTVILVKKNAIHYDGIWCGQHVFVTAVTAFLLYSVQHLTPAYVDVLHRCAIHLGRWRREEGRSANVPYNPWSQLQIFPQGTLVKHVKGLFRAVGIYNSAEPGNNMHNRFFCFFYSSLRLINVMCILVLMILIFQYVLLIQNYEWYKLISVGVMMFFNVFSLYKILRNRFLLGRCYKEESLSNSNVNNSSLSSINGPCLINATNPYHLHTD